jgi:FkbH-like protein
MILRISRFLHVIPLDDHRSLLIHAVKDHRLTIDGDVSTIIGFFNQPRVMPDAMAELLTLVNFDQQTVLNFLVQLMEQDILTDKSPEDELVQARDNLGAFHGRDPAELLEYYRRKVKEGTNHYWSVGSARGLSDFGSGKRLDIILLGDCELQMEADFLRRTASNRGLDVHVAAGFPDDTRLAAERHHDAIIIGALRSRGAIVQPPAPGTQPHDLYIAEAKRILDALRAVSTAPILIDNLPEPTVQPLGMAEAGIHGHRNRFRFANLALADLAARYANVHVIDIAARLASAGADRLLDDGLLSFSHFGSPGWLLQRPESEKAAVHNLFPDLTPLAAQMEGDPYARERVTAPAHVDGLITALGIGAKKCVIVDLDGTLWPGVLAETGAPFAWTPEISGLFSYIGLYVGIHEALKSLKRRGIVLACVSKNDEATVRDLWRYPDHYPKDRLLSLDDFVTHRINWQDKASNILEIASELGFARDAFIFLDDNPIERERIAQALPEIDTLGSDLFSVRRQLLNDPRLQVSHVTAESAMRGDLVKAQLQRDRARASASELDEDTFLASLNIQTQIEKVSDGAKLARLEELFRRTTQFNTNGFKPSAADLASIAQDPNGGVYSLNVTDRFGDHGLVGAACFRGDQILGFVLSCRVIGLRVEHVLLKHMLADIAARQPQVRAGIIETPRNGPARHLYRDHGFVMENDQIWCKRF